MTFLVTISTTPISISIPVTAPAPDIYRCKLSNPDGSVFATKDSSSPSFSFSGVPEGDYVAEMSRLDVAGTVLLASTAPVVARTIPPATMQVDVPGALAVTVTAE